MKTPIPEKINHIDVESNPFVSIILLAQLTGNLIDVLTEQQDRLDRHNNRIEETNKHFGNKIKDLQKEIELLETYIKDHNIWHYTEKSYTAMRSTGEYCMCKEPMESIISCPEGHYNGCDDCGKPIKPQEDVIEDIVIDLIIEAWDLGYKKDGKNRHLIQKYKDRILAIVKGE